MKSICIFLMTTLLLINSHAYTLGSATNSNLQGWTDGNVQLLVNLANCPAQIDIVGLVTAAAEAWNNVPTARLKITYGGTTTSTALAASPTIYCETNFQTVTGADENFVVGAANFATSGGRIVQGLLALNVSTGNGNIANYDESFLKIIMAHEIGHILGLGHSDSTKALMYYDAGAKNNFSLSQDDIDGISYLYPSDESRDNTLAGCGTMQNNLPSTHSQLPLFFMLLLLPLALYGKLRQHKFFSYLTKLDAEQL